MNHVYRLIWSETAAAFVAVSEISRARGRRSSKAVKAASALLLTMMAGVSQAAVDLPTGLEKRVGGSFQACAVGCVSLQDGGRTMELINPDSRMFIRAADVGVGAGFTLKVTQDSKAITAIQNASANQTVINGALSSPGRVFILGAGGILIGKNAVIDVNGLVLSSYGLNADKFLAGNFAFDFSATAGSIVNEGLIRSAKVNSGVENGFVAILAPSITNKGVILASGGSALLWAGAEASLTISDTGLSASSAASPQAGTTAVVNNQGLIKAQTVWMRAMVDSTQPALGDVLVNNSGVIAATMVQKGKAGTVILEARPLSVLSNTKVGTVTLAQGSEVTASLGEGGKADEKQITLSAANIDLHGHTSSDGLFMAALGGDGKANVNYGNGVKLDVNQFFKVNNKAYTVISDLAGLAAVTGQAPGVAGPRYVIGRDINANGQSISPVGTVAAPFRGDLLGLGHEVSNLHVQAAQGPAGLFGATDGALIANLGLSNVTVQGQGAVGAFAGTAQNTKFQSVWASGQVTGQAGNVGGLVGQATGGSVDTAYFSGQVSLTAGESGALGGVVGRASGSSLSNLYATGTLSDGGATSAVGGLVGVAAGGTSLSSVYADEAVTSHAGSVIGGLVGSVGQGGAAVLSGYFRNDAALSYANALGVSLDATGMNQAATFVGFDMSKNWKVYEGHTSPLLQFWLKPITLDVANVSKTYDGLVSQSLSYTVAERYLPYEAGTPAAWLQANPTLARGALVALDTSHVLHDAVGGPWSGAVHVADTGKQVQLWSDQQGYNLSVLNGTITITPKTVTATAALVSKVYDGSTTLSQSDLVGKLTVGGGQLIAGDEVTVVASSAELNSKNVLEAQSAQYQVSLQGASKGDYALSQTALTGQGRVTAKQLTTTAQSVTKVYDGTTAADASAVGLAIAANQIVGNDQVTVTASNAAFNDKNVVAANKVSFTATLDGEAKSNYALAENSTTSVAGSITAKQITTTTAQSVTKVYDGTTTADASAVGLTIAANQIVGNDQVTVTASNAAFNDKNVVAANKVSFTSTLGGEAQSNYALAESAATSVDASITARAVSLKAADVTKDADNVPFTLSVADLSTVGETSFAPGENISVLNGTLTAGPAQNQIAAGSYVVQPGGLASPNYAVTFEGSNLVIAAVSTPTEQPPTTTPTTPPDIIGGIPGGANATPINTNLTGLGDLLSQLPPTAAGEEEDEDKRKARYRRDRSPLRVMDGGVKAAPAQPGTQQPTGTQP